MRRLTSLTAALLLSVCLGAAESETRRYLYLSTPDGAQKQGASEPGILIFDIDNGHKFVRRIEIPIFKEGLRGFAGNLKNHSVYYSSNKPPASARFDLETEKGRLGEDLRTGLRPFVHHDGRQEALRSDRLVVFRRRQRPCWWSTPRMASSSRRYPSAPRRTTASSASTASALYLGTQTMLSVFRYTADDSLIRRFKDVGGAGRFFLTRMDGKERYGYICLGNHVGFDVVNLQTGKALHRVFAFWGDDKDTQPHARRGADRPTKPNCGSAIRRAGGYSFVDATKMPPEPKGHVELSAGGHGWVAFSLDGRYAWSHTPDVFDAQTKKLAATLRDGEGNPVSGSKYIEVHFRDGKGCRHGQRVRPGPPAVISGSARRAFIPRIAGRCGPLRQT